MSPPTPQDTIRLALEAWPRSVPLSTVRADGARPQAKAVGRTTPYHRAELHAAGWRSGSAGWWTLVAP